MRGRAIGNIVTVLFVGVSLYLFWPGILELAPKAVATLKQVPDKVTELLQKNTASWEDWESGEGREVKGSQTEGVETGPLTGAGIIKKTNEERAAAGLPELIYNDRLTKSARLKVEDMILNQYFEHESPTGVTVSDLGNQVGYAYVTMGENLAMGEFTDNQDVVMAWMDSPGHRANILQNKYKEIGVFARKGTYEGKVVWFIVQHFGTSRTSCPTVDDRLKDYIEVMREQTETVEDQIVTLKNELEQSDAPLDPEYDQKVDHYNTLVDQYNMLVKQTREQVDVYNLQVRAFNNCLVQYQ